METFSELLAICAGKSPVTGEFPAQKPVTQSFDLCLNNGSVNNREAADLRRHGTHYDAIVMTFSFLRNRMARVGRSKRKATAYTQKRWTNKEVPYYIANGFSKLAYIQIRTLCYLCDD